VHGAQRGDRVLEDHRDLRAADPLELLLGGAQQLAVAEPRRAGEARVRPARQAQQGHRGHRLAGARLADDGQHLAAVERERHLVDRADDALLGDEGDLEVLDLEQPLAHQPVSLTRGSTSA
jgi:hypothetical protein